MNAVGKRLKRSGPTAKSTAKSASKSSGRPPGKGLGGGASAADHELLQAALVAMQTRDSARGIVDLDLDLDLAPIVPVTITK
jgi:hypothetical protein